MKANKRIKYEEWVITIKPTGDGFEVTRSYQGTRADIRPEMEVYAHGELKQAIKEAKKEIDKTMKGVVRSVKELEDFQE